ncbi:MAG: Rossmann fold domain-containing protein [Pseudomonadota bacterium]
MQRDYRIDALPEDGLAAHAVVMADHLDQIRAVLANDEVGALAVVLAPAASDHRDWRRALAGGLARAHAPKRVNLVAGIPGEALSAMLTYLGDALGVTGQYIECHD